MDNKEQKTVFRKKTLDRISSPEQLTDYLCVTNPGIWILLSAVALLMAGIFAWSMVGVLETTAEAVVVIEDHTAQVIPSGQTALSAGMTLRISGKEFTVASTSRDDYGRRYGTAEVALPDGIYSGTVVIEQTRPIDFLLTSK